MPPVSPFTLYSLLFLTLALPASSSENTLSLTLERDYDIYDSATINIEGLLALTLPTRATTNSTSCKLQNPTLQPDRTFYFEGTFSQKEKTFRFEHLYYVLQINSEEGEIIMISYQLDYSRKGKQQLISQQNRFSFPNSESVSSQILDVQFVKKIGIFSTDSDLLIFNFENPNKPHWVGVFPLHRNPVTSFGIIGDQMLYVAAGDAVVSYDIRNIKKVDIRTRSTFTSYMLPNKEELDINNIVSISTCQNVLFFAEDTKVFVVKEVDQMLSAQHLPVVKVIEVGDEIIQTQIIGRSLVVLTTKEIIEYIFIEDCLNFKENLRVKEGSFQSSSPAPFKEKSSYLSIRGDPEGRYFAVINQLENHIHVFEAATIPDPGNPPEPFYVYTANRNIDSIEFYEHTDISNADAAMVLRRNAEQIQIITLEREPFSLECSHWIAGNETVQLEAKMRFCNNTMFNYTEVLEMEKEKKLGEISYYDPNQPCQRTLLMNLKYHWTSDTIFKIVFTGLLVVVVVVFFVLLFRKKEKRGKRKHKRLQNQKEGAELETRGNKLDISSHSVSSEGDEGNHNDQEGIARKGKKKLSKKKM